MKTYSKFITQELRVAPGIKISISVGFLVFGEIVEVVENEY